MKIARGMILFFMLSFLLISFTAATAQQKLSHTLSDIEIQITGASQPPGFLPSLVTVHTNDEVTFVNVATPSISYTLVANDDNFTSPAIASGGQWSHIFTKVGVYEYHASGFSQHMIGIIIVIPASVKLLATPAPSAKATAIAAATVNKQSTSQPNTASSAVKEVALIGVLVLLILGMSISILLVNRRKHHQLK